MVRERGVRADLEAIRSFLRDQKMSGDIDEPTANAGFDVLSRFQQHVANERIRAPQRISDLAVDSSIDLFALDEPMLACSIDLASKTRRRPGRIMSRQDRQHKSSFGIEVVANRVRSATEPSRGGAVLPRL